VTLAWWVAAAISVVAGVLWVLYRQERAARLIAVRMERWRITDLVRRVMVAEKGDRVEFPPGWSRGEAQRFIAAVREPDERRAGIL